MVTTLWLIVSGMFAKHPARNEIVPYPAYPAGVYAGQDAVYLGAYESSKNPILIIKEDLINQEGRGLKTGFYEVALDEFSKNFHIIQEGQIKARIPIIELTTIKENPPVVIKPKKQKKKKTYYKDKLHDKQEYIHLKAELIPVNGFTYELRYERANTRARGIIKLN